MNRVGLATLAITAACWAMAARPGDPVAANALVAHLEATAPDRADPAWLDAARELRRVRPWQPGFAAARAELGRIERARAPSAPRGR
jgi:hypothetical protein